jgi:hypothetical protein
MGIRRHAAVSAIAFAVVVMQAVAAAAQSRVFVAAQGSDGNPCSFAAPCRTFQRAHDVVTANGEIDVLDPAGYGAVTITKSLSIQGHGYSGVSQSVSNGIAIWVKAGSADVVHLRGLIIDGVGTGLTGIEFDSGASLDISDSVVHHFSGDGILIAPVANSSFSISGTIASDNGLAGIKVRPGSTGSASGQIDRTSTNNNKYGVYLDGSSGGSANVDVVSSVASNNITYAYAAVSTALPNTNLQMLIDYSSFLTHAATGVFTKGASVIFVSRSLGNNSVDFDCSQGGIIATYGNNQIASINGGACVQPQLMQ